MSRATRFILLEKKTLFLVILLLSGVVLAKEKEQSSKNLSAKEIQKRVKKDLAFLLRPFQEKPRCHGVSLLYTGILLPRIPISSSPPDFDDEYSILSQCY